MYNPVPIQPLRFLTCSPWFSPLLLSPLPALIIPALWPLGPSFFRVLTPQCPWVAPLPDSDVTSQVSIQRSLFPTPPHHTYILADYPLHTQGCQSSCLDVAEFLMFKSVSLLLPFCLLSLWEATLWRQSFHVLHFPRLSLHPISAFRYQMTSSVAGGKSRAKNPDGKYPSRTSNGDTNEG